MIPMRQILGHRRLGELIHPNFAVQRNIKKRYAWDSGSIRHGQRVNNASIAIFADLCETPAAFIPRRTRFRTHRLGCVLDFLHRRVPDRLVPKAYQY